MFSRKRVGELLLYAVFIVADAEGLWPHSHLFALVLFVLGSIALALNDGGFSQSQLITWSATVCVASAATFAVVGPMRLPDVQVDGVIFPGKDPVHPEPCDKDEAEFPTTTPEISRTPDGQIVKWEPIKNMRWDSPILTVAQCDVVIMHKDPNGEVRLDINLWDNSGRMVAYIRGTTYWVLTGENVKIDRAGDLSTLIVTNGAGKELLHLRYANAMTPYLRGAFNCPGRSGPPVRVADPMQGTVTLPGATITFPMDTGRLIRENTCPGHVGLHAIWVP